MRHTLILMLLVFFGTVPSGNAQPPISNEVGDANGTSAPGGNTVTKDADGVVAAAIKASFIPETSTDSNVIAANKTGSSTGLCQRVSTTREDSLDNSSLTDCMNTFIFNVSVCMSVQEISMTTTNATIRISKPFQPSENKMCNVKIHVPRNYSVFMSIPMLTSNDTSADRIIASTCEGKFYIHYRITKIGDLENRSVNFTIHGCVSLTYDSRPENHTAEDILIHLGLKQQSLEIDPITNTTFSLTSPFFDGKQSKYPDNLHLVYSIHVPDEHVLIGVFHHFDLGYRCGDRLLFINSTNQTVEEFCETYFIRKVLRFEASITLSFITNSYRGHTGFKFLFSVLPKSYVVLNNGLFDCSGLSFSAFRELVTCNMHFECEAGEDEEKCAYSSEKCKLGEIRAGEKCYKLVWPSEAVSWTNGSTRCVEEGYHGLATMPTAEEWGRFKDLLSFRTKYIYLPVFIGLSMQEPKSLLPFYSDVFSWGDDKLSAFYIDSLKPYSFAKSWCMQYRWNEFNIGKYFHWSNKQSTYLTISDCSDEIDALYICESKSSTVKSSGVRLLELNRTYEDSKDYNLATCPSGELTHTFLLCDAQGPCEAVEFLHTCAAAGVELSMFVCSETMQTIPYTFVCDNKKHCSDYSDEDFCVFLAECQENEFRCHNGQCVDASTVCDCIHQCIDGSDEYCERTCYVYPTLVEPPFQVNMGEKHGHVRLHLNDFQDCPATHFQCHEDLCLPVYLRCNGIFDCLHYEDEDGCFEYTCPGFYRCWGSSVCLHPDHICDNKRQCPHNDDELLCNAECPSVCRCQGLSFKCSALFDVGHFLYLRYLDASGTDMSPLNVGHNHYLAGLRLSHCNLKTLHDVKLPNLIALDLSHNNLHTVRESFFRQLRNLKYLDLSNNPFAFFTYQSIEASVPSSLLSLDLSFTQIKLYNNQTLSCCTKLKYLNMSFSSLYEIATGGFTTTPRLSSVDLSNSPLRVFPLDLLQGLVHLRYVNVDNYKLCCKATLPESMNLKNCHFKEDELASCDDLVHSVVYRVVLWFFAFLSLFGNAGSFVARLYMSRGNAGSIGMGSFSVLVSSLSIADFFMGVYLAMIGIADSVFRERYLWAEDEWKKSSTCRIAGFLSLMSSEVSGFIICLITMDRFLVLRFPFSRFHFTKKVALMGSATAWLVGVVLAAIPLLPVTSHWNFYSQSGICVPLPFMSSSNFKGYPYSLSIMICLNFALFLLIAFGQMFIYMSVRANAFTQHKNKSRDATLARRLTTIALSDFLCWFPVGLVGLLAFSGISIPPGINVFVAIFILPFNSALNPFLYTINIVMERRRKVKEARLLKRLETRYLAEMSVMEDKARPSKSFSKDSAISQLDIWFAENLLTPQDVYSRLRALAASDYTPMDLPTGPV